MHSEQGKPEWAAILLGAAEPMREDHSTPISPSQRDLYDKTVDAIRKDLTENAIAIAWNQGRNMPLKQAVEYALKTDEG